MLVAPEFPGHLPIIGSRQCHWLGVWPSAARTCATMKKLL
jgi:hypothetical protein